MQNQEISSNHQHSMSEQTSKVLQNLKHNEHEQAAPGIVEEDFFNELAAFLLGIAASTMLDCVASLDKSRAKRIAQSHIHYQQED